MRLNCIHLYGNKNVITIKWNKQWRPKLYIKFKWIFFTYSLLRDGIQCLLSRSYKHSHKQTNIHIQSTLITEYALRSLLYKRTSLTLFAMKNFVIARTHHTPTLGVVATALLLKLLLLLFGRRRGRCCRSFFDLWTLYQNFFHLVPWKKRNWPEHTVTSSFCVCVL